ncbi:hypothetical protein GCM10017710_32730 [Arthrobacter ramosus]
MTTRPSTFNHSNQYSLLGLAPFACLLLQRTTAEGGFREAVTPSQGAYESRGRLAHALRAVGTVHQVFPVADAKLRKHSVQVTFNGAQ